VSPGFRTTTNELRLRILAFLLALIAAAAPATGLPAEGTEGAEDMVQMDFQDQELKIVIDTIARATGKNFIYDDRVRGRVTIVSPTPMPLEQAYAVFESVLQVKGFTIVETPGGALKVIPLRDAKETSVETVASSRPPPNRDRYVTRLIPLRYIDAESIVNTLKPLVSKDAAMAAYSPTNTVILTESSSNIRRLISILESIDIELYKEELAVIRIEFADAGTMAQQISEIYGAQVTSAARASSARRPRTSSRRGTAAAAAAAGTPPGMPASQAGKVRILTDERTNSLIVLAPKTQLEEVRRLVRKLDVPVAGGGRIHVYYLQHADAEELGQTLSSMISGTSSAPAGGAAGAAGAQAIRTTVSGLAEGISVTADPATNSLIIQASQEGFNTLAAVIEKLDVPRPQVLVEALIMEVDVSNAEELGFNGLLRLVSNDIDVTIAQGTDTKTIEAISGAVSDGMTGGAARAFGPFLANFLRNTTNPDSNGIPREDGSVIRGILRAAAQDSGTNILSAPHILTSDNEEAEIRIGDNIPIISSRLDGATGVAGGGLSTSVNVERQDIGVTLRVTPQITEGDTLRLDIFQEITATNEALQTEVGDPESVGVALSNRRIENTVVVSDGDTVVIGGLISTDYQDTVVKVPWLGDIPFFGWLFKTTQRGARKVNLLVFLTPHIVRSKEELVAQTIRKREQFRESAENALKLTEREEAWERTQKQEAEARGEIYEPGRGVNPVRHALIDHSIQYPLEQMIEIERRQQEAAELRALAAQQPRPEYFLQAGLFTDETEAVNTLTTLVDLGYDGTLVTSERGGRMLYEVRVGPYDGLESAQAAIRVLERSTGLLPTVLIQTPETQ